MSYVTYTPNEIVYIRDIGYATLLNCGARSSISQKLDAPPAKKQSIYFDPDLFNSDGDSNHSKKSASKSEDEKIDKKIAETIVDKSSEQQPASNGTGKVEQKEQVETVNIVQARLEGGTGVVYTSQKNLTKSIFVAVKSLLITKKEQIIVEIEISKTIDTLKKQIFTQIGEQISHYYNLRLFALSPALAELNVPSKTIAQCHIKDNAKLILTADYAFTFRPIIQPKNSKYKLTLTNNTLISSKIVDQPKKVQDKTPIPLPPPPQSPSQTAQTKPQEKKPQQKAENKPSQTEQKKEQSKPTQVKKQIGTQVVEQQRVESGPFNAKCTVDFTSGVRYWQIKLEKLPIDEEDLVVGLCVQSTQKDIQGYWHCQYAWAYQVITGKKVYVERSEDNSTYQEEVEPYGYALRQNDILGVLLQFKGKKTSVTFYKNSVSCGQAFSIDLQTLKERRQLVPFVNVGGECQITLDSKTVPPVDSYRSK